MKKLLFTIGILFWISVMTFGQDTNAPREQTSYDRFVSRSGAIIRFQDYSLPELKGNYGTYENRVRVLSVASETTVYYQIVNPTKYSSIVGSISKADIVETMKAVESLLQTFQVDVASKPDYIENKFVTNDGVAIGYYVSSKGGSWFINLDKYKSDSTIFLRDGQQLKILLESAKARMDALEK